MKWTALNGRVYDIKVGKYLVDWDAKQGSKFSKGVLDWLKPYWKGDVVLAEMPLPGSRKRYDFVNVNQRLVVETDGKFHTEYSAHFHGSLSAYRAQFQRDLDKDKVAGMNGYKMIRITPSDLPLTKEWFKVTYDVNL